MANLTGIFWLAIAHGLFQTTIIAFNKRGVPSANRWMCLLVFLLILPLWNTVADGSGLHPFLKGVDFNLWVSPYVWGPALYLYVEAMTGQHHSLDRYNATHFIPAIIVLVLSIIVSLAGPISANSVLVRSISDVTILGFYVHVGSYLILTVYRLRERRGDYSAEAHVSSPQDRTWLRRFVAMFGVLILIDMSIIVPMALRGEESSFYEFVLLAETVMVFCIGYYYLIQTGIDLRFSEPGEKEKYQQSPITSDMSAKYLAELNATMDEFKPYLRNDLKLPDLAEIANIPVHYLSQIINEGANCNFYEYVNSFRVRHAADLLTRSERANITRVAYEAGFNNRVSFNNAFKKHYGMTPSKYRDCGSQRNRQPEMVTN